MKKRISTRVICLLVALALLTGALMVSAINGSPYEALKNAALDALFFENVTIEMEAVLRVDGEVYEQTQMRYEIGDDRTLTFEVDGDQPLHISYETPYFRLNTSVVTEDGIQWYAIRRQNNIHRRNSIGYDMFGAAGGRNSNQLRLVEVLVDLFVGDLKNNFVISSYGNDMRRVTGAVTESQLPEIIRVLIDLGIEESTSWRNTDNMSREDFSHVLDIPITGLTINRVQITADIENNGHLRTANITGQVTIENIFGDTHVLDAEFNLAFSDIGTTMPASPFPGVHELFAPDFFANVGGGTGLSRTLYFALDADGNINVDSITPNWPVAWSLGNERGETQLEDEYANEYNPAYDENETDDMVADENGEPTEDNENENLDEYYEEYPVDDAGEGEDEDTDDDDESVAA